MTLAACSFKALIRLQIIPVPLTRFKPIIHARRVVGPAGQGQKPLRHYKNHYTENRACSGFIEAKSTRYQNHYTTTAKTAPLRARVQARACLRAHARACGGWLYWRSGVVPFPFSLENKGKCSGFGHYGTTTEPLRSRYGSANLLKSFEKVGI